MYDYFRGTLVEKNDHYAVVDIGGIGYKLIIPSSLCDKLPHVGQNAHLFTSWIVREMSQTLYGFFSKEERDLFELLLTVSGIGPKTALGLIGHFEPSALEDVVRKGNAAALAKAPGIGKKTAEKLLLELKNRLKISSISSFTSHSHDALNALMRLGYSQNSAEQAVKKALKEGSSEEDLATLITAALKYPRN